MNNFIASGEGCVRTVISHRLNGR